MIGYNKAVYTVDTRIKFGYDGCDKRGSVIPGLDHGIYRNMAVYTVDTRIKFGYDGCDTRGERIKNRTQRDKKS